ncbi:hypothetical protein NG701_20755 [Pseudarthrobacter sp. HLT3-5]|uniref:hypothetical protein n=1 Tax=Pseudarthrobacter cellobiosi TaxID=2953654 RepID=UPI00208F8531|nr:hypothetical protein [Pseudarthrobacter sp. HLT3-5]MCO4276814.1 hypothetical protein [Pseudarthrobacter sp. HLT3-5]
MPDEASLDRAVGVTPEFARFLYGLVGGPWHWTDRLEWTRQQWAEELAVPGTEFWVHTCTLDGPAALANYQSRGFEPCGTEDADTEVAEEPLGSWVATAVDNGRITDADH